MKRHVRYKWRLREIMATRGLFNTADLARLLVARGIERSQVQVWRLVTGTPERLSLPLLAALCDILEVTPAELIVTSAEPAGPARCPGDPLTRRLHTASWDEADRAAPCAGDLRTSPRWPALPAAGPIRGARRSGQGG
jgi:DNA-binding Xre family transcriptional regulator